MKTIITKVENNRVIKFLEIDDELAVDKLAEIQINYPSAFIYNGKYLPSLWFEGEVVSIVPILEADPREFIEVTAFQAHAAIARAGLYDAVEAIMNNPATPLETLLAWRKAQSFKRLSPTVLIMGAVLNLSESALDELFNLAKTIEA